jgi:putative SOS response-associated peptidase YedK
MFAAMCGLYSFRSSPEEVRSVFSYPEEAQFPPRPYVAPSQPIAIVRMYNDARQFALVRWGLIPAWVKEPKSGKPLINARSETVFEKPSFRTSIKRRRCLIPADGFYEWTGDVPGRKQPFHIHRPDGRVFAFAGLWDHWLAPDGSEMETAAIITTAANDTLAPIHHRMPVVIQPRDFEFWLTADETRANQVAPLMQPAANDFFIAEPTEMQKPSRPSRQTPAPPAPGTDQLDLF